MCSPSAGVLFRRRREIARRADGPSVARCSRQRSDWASSRRCCAVSAQTGRQESQKVGTELGQQALTTCTIWSLYTQCTCIHMI